MDLLGLSFAVRLVARMACRASVGRCPLAMRCVILGEGSQVLCVVAEGGASVRCDWLQGFAFSGLVGS